MIASAAVVLVLCAIGVPIAFALGLAGAAGLLTLGEKLIIVPTRMFTGIDSFVLLAAPFYIFAGEVMNRGGVTDRLIRFSQIVTGRLRGGTAYACTFASVLFAGISGTAIADTAALGQVFIKGMPKEGYTKEYAAAVVLVVPLLLPAARSMHVDIMQFSMLVNLTLTIGVITPPVGVSLFVAMRIGEIGMWKLVKETLPFLAAEVAVVVLLILYPPFSSWLPGLLHR